MADTTVPTTAFVCARCGVNAAPLGTRWINKDGRTLEFCGHHTDEHGPALQRQGWTRIEISVLLETAPKPVQQA